MNLTVKDLEQLYVENGLERKGFSLTIVQQDPWEESGKSYLKCFVFTDGKKYYRGCVEKYGTQTNFDYASDIYGNGEGDYWEVVKQEVVKTEWVAI